MQTKENSEAVIPELIYWLIKQSVPDSSICRIPHGNDVNQPGRDGLVESEAGYLEFVPEGRSCWEIGTPKNPKKKATDDFNRRTCSLSDYERRRSTFVFVTPRSARTGGWNEPEQTEWLEERKNTEWKSIRIIDGIKLADWLREFPAVGLWMAKKIGLSSDLGGLSTLRMHWDLIGGEMDSGDPPLPPELFIAGRGEACNALQKLFEGTESKLQIFAESSTDVADFVAAYIETLDKETKRSYSNRCLLISNEDAWRSVVGLRKSHVLVADPRLALETQERADLQIMAKQNGHAVVVPICGVLSGEGHKIVKLGSPSKYEIEKILNSAGYSNVRAREIVGIGGDRISAIRRHLLNPGTPPPYATWKIARFLAQAALVGKWDGNNPADRTAIEELVGRKYGKWIEQLRDIELSPESPLVQIDEKWRFVARGEAWGALGNRITDDNLKNLKKVAIEVLGARDPKFNLPKEQRFAANIYGKELKHSRYLREGLAETLALVGSRSDSLSVCFS